VEDTNSSQIKQALRDADPSAFSVVLLRIMPYSISFHERLKLVRGTLEADKISVQGVDDMAGGFFSPQNRRSEVFLTHYLLYDYFS
jgi:hypothetical protein